MTGTGHQGSTFQSSPPSCCEDEWFSYILDEDGDDSSLAQSDLPEVPQGRVRMTAVEKFKPLQVLIPSIELSPRTAIKTGNEARA